MKKVERKGVWWAVLLGILWCLNSHAVLAEDEDTFQIAQEEAMASFDFSKVDESLRKMFPDERVSFRRYEKGRRNTGRLFEGSAFL